MPRTSPRGTPVSAAALFALVFLAALMLDVAAPARAQTTVPGAPQNLAATAGDTEVTLAWAAPASDGGGAITKYRYRYSTGSTVSANATWADVPDGSDTGSSTADETGVTVSGLNNGAQYAFEVLAVNSAGEGAKAGPVTATPADMTPPSLVSALVGPTGTVMVVTFNEIPVSSGATNALANAAFTITAGGTGVSFLAAWVNHQIAIEIPSPIRQGQSVVYSYADPDTTDNFNIRDAAGNETPSFTTGMNGVPAVSNQSTVRNNAPTAEDKTVTTAEDTGYAFQASDFNFADTDTGDALASVTVVTLPGSGALELNGAAVTVNQVVAAGDLGDLVFTPAADANGEAYTSFTFKVSEGIDESASAYTMTIDVTAVNDAASGGPSISGTATVGQTLKASTSGIGDVDGKTKADAGEMDFAYAYQWVRVDGLTETDISGATSGTYTLADADAGKKVKVKVTFTDDDGTTEGPLSSGAYPSGATVLNLTVTLAVNPLVHWEGGGAVSVEVTATLGGDARARDTVLALTATGSGSADAVDFTPVPDFTLIIPAGMRHGTALFTLTPEDDLIDESDETVTVAGTVQAIRHTRVSAAKLFLSDEEMPPDAVLLSLSRETLSEGGGAVVVAVTATLNGDVRASDTPVAVTVSGSGLPGVVGFAPVAPFTLTIPARRSHAAAVFTLAPQDDNTDEGDETVTVSGAAAGLQVDTATLVLSDDDQTSTMMNWRVSPLSIAEGAGATDVTVTARLDAAASTTDLVFEFLLRANNRNFAIEEYNSSGGTPRFDVTIPAGATVGTGVLTVTPVQDIVVEPDVSGGANRLQVEINKDLGFDSAPDADLPVEDVDRVRVTIIDDDTDGPDMLIRNCQNPTGTQIEFRPKGTQNLASVTGFVFSDVVMMNGRPTALSGSGAEYILTYEPLADFQGEVTVLVPFGVAQDAQDRGNNAGSCTADVDWRDPRVAITGPPAGPVTGPFLVRLAFDEEVKGFELADLTVDNGAASGLRRIEGAGWEYVATITPAGPGEVTVELAANRVQDAAGRGNVAARFSIASVVPAVLLSLSRETLSEGGGAVVVAVTATLNGDVQDTDTPVAVTVSGSGLPGVVGFAPVAPFTLTIPARRSHAAAVFTLAPQDDNTDEADETVTVSGAAAGLQVDTATLVLSDDDQTSTMVNWRVSPLSIAEGAGATDVTVTARLDAAASTTDLVFEFGLRGYNQLIAIEEYNAPRVVPFDVTIPAGATVGTGVLTVTPVQDSVVEPDVLAGSNRLYVENVTDLGIDTATDADMPLEHPDGVRVTIIDDDTDGPDMLIRNCQNPTGTQIEFRAKGTANLASVTGFVFSDVVMMNGRPTALSGSGAEYILTYEPLADFQGEVTVLVPFGVAQDAQDRGNNAGSCTADVDWRDPRVAITGPPAGPVTGPFLVRLAFDEEVKGFELVDLTVDNGAASGLRRIEGAGWEYVATITPAGPGEVTVELAANRVQDAAGRGNVAARFSIASAVPAVLLSLSRETLSEGGGAVVVAVTATLNGDVRASDTPVAVTVSGSGLPGVVGFAPVAPFTLTIPARRSHAAAVFTLAPQDDNTDEADETVTVSGAAAGLQVDTATLVLSDDDQTSTGLRVQLSQQTVSEGAGSAAIPVTVALNGVARTVDTEVTMTVSGSGSGGEVGFAAIDPSTFTIAANSTAVATSFTLRPVNDDVDTADATVTVVTTATGLTQGEATLRITDDEESATRVTLAASRLEIAEGAEAATVTVTARHNGAAVADPIPVAMSVSGVTAEAEDFAPVADFTLTIPAGAMSAEAQFVLDPEADDLDEPNETLAVRGVADALTVAPVTLTIIDDDDPPRLAVANVTASEGAGALDFAVTLDAASGRQVSVSYATRDGAALADTDYGAAAATLTFAPGDTRRTVTVKLIDDDLYEMAETFELALGNPEHATLARAVAAGRILDNDPMPRIRLVVVSPSPAVLREDDGAALITVIGHLEGAKRSADTTLQLSVTGVTAGEGDFDPVTAPSLMVRAGASAGAAVFELAPVADSAVEADETVAVGSTTPMVQVIPAIITIRDDDDMTAPALSEATVENAVLTLTYNEALDEASVPTNSAFTVQVAGAARTVDNVTVKGTRVTLTLASAVSLGQSVTVSYVKPQDNPIRDVAGNDAIALTNEMVDEGTPPVVSAVEIISEPGGAPYGLDDTIEVRVTFSETVVVTGTPVLYLTVGGARRKATHDAEESSGKALVFAYRVMRGDSDNDGIGIAADSLALSDNDNTIQTQASITDSANNAADLSHAGVAADFEHQVDGVVPALTSAVVQAASLVLTFDEALAGSSVPDKGAFSVSVDGGAGALPASVAVSGTTATLTLTAAVRATQSVTVSYTKPSMNALKDLADNNADGFSDHPVDDATVPVLVTAEVNGTELVLTYNETLDTGSVPGAGAFTVKVGGAAVSLASSGPVAISGSKVTLTLAETVMPGDTVTVSYAVPSSNPVQDPGGTDAVALTDHPVTNRTVEVTVPSAPASFTATEGNTQVTLSWSAPFDGNSPIARYRYRYAAGTAVPPGTAWIDVPDSDNDGDSADERGVTVTGLVNQTQYAFEVRAVNGEGAGPPASATATPVEDPNLPSGVLELRALLGDGAVTLTWGAPARSGGSRIDRYEYRHAAGSTVPASASWHRMEASRYPFVGISGLENGQGYTFEVRAVNLHGFTGPAAVLAATPRAGVAQTLPTAPRGLRAEGSLYERGVSEFAQVTLSWQTPSDLGNALLVRYEYRYAAGGGSMSSARWNHGPISERTTTVRNLAVGASYTFQLRAVTGTGAGATAAVGVSTPRSTRLSLSVFTRGSAVEGERLTIGVRRSGLPDPDAAVLVVVEIDDSTASHPTNRAVDIPPGARQGTIEFPVPFDGERGAARELAVTLHPGSWVLDHDPDGVYPWYTYRVGTPSRATVRVRNMDPLVSVWDATVREGPGAQLSFAVTLDRAAARTVTVDYATSDETATAGSDYTSTSGRLRFAVGETAKTVSVPVLDDAHDEGIETLTLRLSNAQGAALGDAEATGRIVNTGPMPKAWIARFGRTVADHVLGAVNDRMQGGSAASTRMTLGGREVLLDAEWPKEGEALRASLLTGAKGLGGAGDFPRGSMDPREEERLFEHKAARADASASRAASMNELLLASSFHLASAEGTEDAPRWTLWGRGARSGFNGRDGGLNLKGDVTTGLVGADYESGKALVGVALAWSTGDGSYAGAYSRGELESTLTSVYPYLRYRMSERLSVWGVVGLGEGDLKLKTQRGETMETDLSLSVAALGVRGALLARAGYELAVKSDFTLVQTESEATRGLASAEAETRRLRLVLEGSRKMDFGKGSLTPSFEIGVRYDGGDAETGAGVELGGGVRYAASGLTMEVRVRGLLAHEERDYEEWGVSASVVFSPGSGGRGLSVRVGSAWGAASGGAERIWTGGAAGLAREVDLPGASIDAEVAYGLDALRGLLTPYTGVALTESGETWRAGARWKLGPAIDVSLEASLKESAAEDKPESGLLLRGSRRW